MNPFEKLGMKEVADVMFIALSDEGTGPNDVKKHDVVLYLDTLKVSTIDITAEEAEARGGKGNPALISWDFGKEIAVSLDDAVFSMTSLQFMTGGKKTTTGTVEVHKTKLLETADDITAAGNRYSWVTPAGIRGSHDTTATDPVTTPLVYNVALNGTRIFYTETQAATAAHEIVINAENFPGTYKVIGDTIVRDTDGVDHPFQFVIPKAKVGSEVSFAMETDGDPAVFSMSLKVLRNDDKEMLKLIKYEKEKVAT